MDYVPETDHDTDNQGELEASDGRRGKKKRRKKYDIGTPEMWKRNKNKQKRQKGFIVQGHVSSTVQLLLNLGTTQKCVH